MSSFSSPERLKNIDWEDILPRLLLVARRYYNQALRSFPGAPEPRDLVQQAIADLLGGQRTLPPDVPVFNTLCGIIRSQASNFVARQQPVGAGDHPAGTRHRPLDPKTRAAPSAPDMTVEEKLFRKKVLALIGDRPLDRRIVDLLLKDPALKPADLAALLDVPIREIYNAKRRLRRKLIRDPRLSVE